jgi:hypothetical protein
MKPCPIPHDADGLPQFLCRICHPNLGDGRKRRSDVAAAVVNEPTRDFRIPKGMSTEEGNAMLANRQRAQQEKSAEALAALKAKHEGEFYDKKLKAWLPLAAKGN